MRLAVLVLAALATLAPCGAEPARADTRGAFASFVRRLTVRMGVACDSLVVLPLVLDAAPDGEPGLAAPDRTETWAPLPESQVLVDVVAAGSAAPRERFVAPGTLLAGGATERMTLRPFPLRDGESARVATVPCDGRRNPAEGAAPAGLGRLAPFEQRKLALLGRSRDALALVQRIQSVIAGLPESAETVAEVLAAKYCGDVEQHRMAALSRIPKAYAGRAVGHVAFFGYRPVEVVAFARPADYQALGPAYLRSIAVSHAFWAELLGGAAARSADDEMRRLVAEAEAVVAGLARANPREQPGTSGERCRWKPFAGSAETDLRGGGHVERFAFRFATDDRGQFAFLEAVESGSDLVFPPPYREPGGRPVGEPPSNKGGGMTPAAMQRILDRLLERRR